jgi:hypothetical protein
VLLAVAITDSVVGISGKMRKGRCVGGEEFVNVLLECSSRLRSNSNT